MTSQSAILLFRVDADSRMGTGHVMRCLALAQSWQDGGGQAFFLTSGPAALAKRLRGERIEVLELEEQPGSSRDAAATAGWAKRLGASWVVLDGYHFDPAFHQAVREGGVRLLAFDDGFPFGRHCADLILNQNLYAGEALYAERAAHSQLLLGPRYLLLRREFLPWRDRAPRQIAAVPRRLLVTLGGADPDNVTLVVLRGLALLPASTFDVTVLVGAANRHAEALGRAARDCPCAVEVRPATDDMPAALAQADLAVIAGGTTTWEAAFMGLPAAVVALADNQRLVAATAAAEGLALDLGWHAHLTPERVALALSELHGNEPLRASMAQAGQQRIDGEGVERVRQQLRGERLRLRRARREDARLLWEWANDPEVRRRSFHPEAIPWDDHVRWLDGKLQAVDSFLFIAVDAADNPLGQARLDLSAPGEAIVSVSVARARWGAGWGTELIAAVTDWGWRGGRLQRAHAFIKPDNLASLRAFARAGYQVVSSTVVHGQGAVVATCERPAAGRQAA
jgi:UDP-2,4-diacetamido-2,4,6-trideoxy-beta-L-altropyranose hydrolase